MPSISSKLFNLYVRALGFKKNAPKRWANPPRDPKAMQPPRSLFKKCDIQKQFVHERRVFTITPTEVNNKHILFFHGGAYADEISIWHWRFVANILKRTKCKISVIEYPLTPEHTHKEAFKMVKTTYELLTKDSNEDFIFMGDSAGGGLSLAFAQLAQKENIQPRPTKLVLISPWVDIELSEPIPLELDKKDFILNIDAVKLAGKNYVGDGDGKHFLVSPIYGNFKGLCEVGIWAGTSEIFLPDMPKLIAKLENANVPFRYFEGEDMQHDYPLFPTSEGVKGMKSVCEFINQ